MRYLISILFSLSLALNSTADDLVTDLSPSKILSVGKSWKAIRKLKDQKVSLQFQLNASPATPVLYSPAASDAILVAFEVVSWHGKEYFVTLWQEGVHSAAARVFDPTQVAPVVFELSSEDSIVYKIVGDGLEFRTLESVRAGGASKDKITKWKAVDK